MQNTTITHAERHEFGMQYKKRLKTTFASASPSSREGCATHGNKQPRAHKSMYKRERERTHDNNESLCVWAEDCPHPFSNQILSGGCCAETAVRELGKMGSQRNAVDAYLCFIRRFWANMERQQPTPKTQYSSTYTLDLGTYWFDLKLSQIFCTYEFWRRDIYKIHAMACRA